MSGVVALLASLLAFLVPLAVPLFAQRWGTFVITLGLAAAFFWWLTLDVAQPSSIIGTFLGGLMLFGFAAGSIAKFVMLVGKR